MHVHFQCFEISRSFKVVSGSSILSRGFSSIIFGPDFKGNPRAPCCLSARWDFQTLAEGGAVYWPSCICTANDLNLVCKTYCWRTPYTREIEQPRVFSMVCWSVLINKKAGNRDDKTTRSVVMVKQTLKWLPPLISFAWFVLHQPPQLSTPLGEPFAERKHPISCIFWRLAIIG